MERILVAMDTMRTRLFAGIHALHLARRINAKVLFLLIFPVRKALPKSEDPQVKSQESAVKKRVEEVIEEARSDGISVDYYITYGDFESELVSFIHENNITLLVVECPVAGGVADEACKDLLNKLRHRINCRIEVVNMKPETPQRKE